MTLMKPNVLKHEMLGTNGGKDSTCIREFFKDQVPIFHQNQNVSEPFHLVFQMKCTCTVDEVETVRVYDRKE